MPLALVLDEHISPAVARMLRERGVDAVSIPQWHSGNLLSAGDDVVLAAAHAEGRILVTFDLATIPDLIGQMVSSGTDHSGVILVSQKSVKSNDFAGLAERLTTLAKTRDASSMTNTADFL